MFRHLHKYDLHRGVIRRRTCILTATFAKGQITDSALENLWKDLKMAERARKPRGHENQMMSSAILRLLEPISSSTYSTVYTNRHFDRGGPKPQ